MQDGAFPKKIAVVGTSGCGKTTLGAFIAKKLSIPFIDLDDLYWLPDWVKREDEDFIQKVHAEFSKYPSFVVCGNYRRHQADILEDTDMVIWLDYPLITCLWRAFKRSLSRYLFKEPCCNGNYETLSRLFGRDSIVLWIWNTYPKRKAVYTAYFENPPPGKHVIRLTSDLEVAKFRSLFQKGAI